MLILIHVCAAIVGIISGYVALIFKKGSGRHQVAGTMFCIAMMVMTTSAAYIAAFLRPVPINVVAASLTFYLVSTAWVAARRREASVNAFDWAALILGLAVTVDGIGLGFQVVGSASGKFAPVYFIFGSVAFLFSMGDVRMLMRGGVSGAKRIARHLWRVSFALLIAILSLYPGQAKLFSAAMRESKLIFAPHIFLVVSMFYWLWRIRFRRKQAASRAPVSSGELVVSA